MIIAALLLGGCNYDIQKSDQLGMRRTLLSVYEEQIMDNLYRTSNGLPVLQLDYTQITGTTGVTFTENGSGGQNTGLGINSSNVPQAQLGALVPISNAWNWTLGASGTQSSQIAVTANPVTVTTLNGSDDIYAVYIEYLKGDVDNDEFQLEQFALRHPSTCSTSQFRTTAIVWGNGGYTDKEPPNGFTEYQF
jgi:hypothetical protein